MPAFSAVATCFGCSAYPFRRFGKDKAFGPVFGGAACFRIMSATKPFPVGREAKIPVLPCLCR